MSRQSSSPQGRRTERKATKPQVRIQDLFSHVLADVAKYLAVDVVCELYATLYHDESSLRDVIDRHTLKAESSLADGGFEAYACLRQLQAVIKKNTDWYAETPKHRSEKAIAGFSECNDACRETNTRLNADRLNPIRGFAVHQVLNLAKVKVHEVLGELTEERYLECLRKADFGPGSPYVPDMGWTDTRGLQFKIAGNQTVTRKALPHAILALRLNDGWLDSLLTADAQYAVVDEGALSTVIKNAVIDRVIEQQPSLCVYLQKGVGAEMARLLLSVGIDLSSQARNHRAARQGSLDGQTATVDMTSASDLIAVAMVKWLFPEAWFELLSDIKVDWGKYPDGKLRRHEMFSTMGNATTFPMQCLVFYSVAWATCVLSGDDVRKIRVYGDDVIVPVGAVALMFETLRYCGHKPNVAKTYVWGPMRESCGKDYVQGIDIRPVYVDTCPKTDMEVMSVHNRLALMAMMPLPRTLSYLRNRARDLWGPPDLGASLEEAYEALIGSHIAPRWLKRAGLIKTVPAHTAFCKKNKKRLGASLAVDSYFVADPPPPAGYCSAVQSVFYVFKGYSTRAKPSPDETPGWLNWRAILYGAKLLSSHKGDGSLEGLKFPTSESTTFTREVLLLVVVCRECSCPDPTCSPLRGGM